MLFYEDPPLEENPKDFPVLDEVVNVSNCYYYLSLLERFVDVTGNMNKEDLKQYLVRAESRYFRWILCPSFKMSMKRQPPPLGIYKLKEKVKIFKCILYYYRCCLFLASTYAKSTSIS